MRFNAAALSRFVDWGKFDQFRTFHTLLLIAREREREMGMDVWSNGQGLNQTKEKHHEWIVETSMLGWVSICMQMLGNFLKTCWQVVICLKKKGLRNLQQCKLQASWLHWLIACLLACLQASKLHGQVCLGFLGQDEFVSNCVINCNILISPTTTTVHPPAFCQRALGWFGWLISFWITMCVCVLVQLSFEKHNFLTSSPLYIRTW